MIKPGAPTIQYERAWMPLAVTTTMLDASVSSNPRGNLPTARITETARSVNGRVNLFLQTRTR